jgi:eukaryotic-like serine/threonine-protein kinase
MTAPATTHEFLALVEQSGLVRRETMAQLSQKKRTEVASAESVRQAANILIAEGLLTHFQADAILQGKWRRFTIGRYRVLDQLGAGGMGQVYLCEHLHMKRRVALKVLPIAQLKNGSALERFYREARATAVLNHPNIVRSYDIGEEDNLHFLVMEYVEGSTLQELVQRQGPMAPLAVVNYMRQAALGLAHIQQASLVHRDMKPSNLVVDLTGTVKILDLGLARFFEDDNDNLTIKQRELMLGTVDFLSPEQAINSHGADIRADIYGLAATMYYCLTGQSPMGHGSMAQKLLWLQSRNPQPIEDFRNDIPAELITVIEKAMEKDPEHRYQTPAELIAALDDLPMLTGETGKRSSDITLTKPAQWGVVRMPTDDVTRWAWVSAGVAMIFAMFLLILLIASSGSSEPKKPAIKPPAKAAPAAKK